MNEPFGDDSYVFCIGGGRGQLKLDRLDVLYALSEVKDARLRRPIYSELDTYSFLSDFPFSEENDTL